MSARLPGIDARTQGIGAAGIGSIDGPGSAASDLDLGQLVGGMGAMDLLGTTRQMNIRANAIDLVIALDQSRDRSAKNVIASLA